MTSCIERRPAPARVPEALSHLPATLARVLAVRGFESHDDLDLRANRLLPPAGLPDIDTAASLIAEAITADQTILVVGDYDADGATATAIAVRALGSFGAKSVHFTLPDRQKHGYGLSPQLIEDWISENAVTPDLIVTVDNGVSAHAGVEAAQAHGIKVVVTDHHLPGDTLPKAEAMVNPNIEGSTFPSTAIAGCGVSFYVMAATRAKLGEYGWFTESHPQPNMMELMDLVAVGTIADVVPLDANNRRLVSLGLARIKSPESNRGVAALFEAGGRDRSKAKSTDLGFVIGPRLNAAGRIADMRVGVECLLADHPARALQIAMRLESTNRERKEIEQDMLASAGGKTLDSVADMPRPERPEDWIVYQPDFHQGVIGIVAGRLKEQWIRPTFVFAPNDPEAVGQPGALIKGSGRSVPGVHLRDLLVEIDALEPGLLVGFGGHAMAAGLSIHEADLARFQSAFARVIDRHADDLPEAAVIESDGPLAPADFNLQFAAQIESLVPWGTGCPEPVFDDEFEVLGRKAMGGGKHWKLAVRSVSDPDKNRVVEAVWFGIGNGLPDAQRLHLAYRIGVNHYRGNQTLQLMVVGGTEVVPEPA